MDLAQVTGLAFRLEATLLAADARGPQIDALVEEATRLGCGAVCVPAVWVERAVGSARRAGACDLRIVSVAGFPLGASPLEAKLAECRFALAAGAGELDIVAPIWAIVDHQFELAEREIATLLEATTGAVRKLILEVGLLPAGPLSALIDIVNRLRPEFAKTGTGYSRGVTDEDVRAMRAALDPGIGIKAAGGIRTRAQAVALVRAGADRLGTSRPGDILGGVSEGAAVVEPPA